MKNTCNVCNKQPNKYNLGDFCIICNEQSKMVKLAFFQRCNRQVSVDYSPFFPDHINFQFGLNIDNKKSLFPSLFASFDLFSLHIPMILDNSHLNSKCKLFSLLPFDVNLNIT